MSEAPRQSPIASVSCDARYLSVSFTSIQRCLSWALISGGFALARGVAWHRVRNAELPPGLDPEDLLRRRLDERALSGFVGLLTSADLQHYTRHRLSLGDLNVEAVATVGLSNALRTGDSVDAPRAFSARVGTINLSLSCSAPLSDLAMIEAIALISEARTAAVMSSGARSVISGRPATGTGTDCFVMSCAQGRPRLPFAGKHTRVGQLIGATVEEAVGRGVRRWLRAYDEVAAAAEAASATATTEP